MKTSWGIVIFIDCEALNTSAHENPIKVDEGIFLIIPKQYKGSSSIEFWLKQALHDMKKEIDTARQNNDVFFNIQSITHSNVDYQEEALYYAMQVG